MAEKVAKLGVKREPGFLYFLKASDVWKAPMKRAGGPSAAGKAEKVASGNFKKEDVEWMHKEIAPTMSKILNLPMASKENPKGFGCPSCHPVQGP